MNILTKFENGEYIIDANGSIPAINFQTESGDYLILCPRMNVFNFKEKVIILAVEEFIKNQFSGKWINFYSDKFVKDENGSFILISNENLVDRITGLNTNSENPNAIGEFDFYMQNIAIPIIFPGIQSEFQSRFNLT